ncbi:MAG: 3-phosphoshikimate 1-carboxyvinyltransferase [Candidatus Omnitrophota bacterium]|nr:3-phosphoshikimate 1-carboxyvinyltransferase [Candidatus Omnitrophota bacterium]
MEAIIEHASGLRGSLRVPPDKAICHRAVLAASIAQGRTEITPWPSADDCQRTLQLVRDLGVAVNESARAVRIEGRGADALHAPSRELFCGESGTTLRLCAGLLAGQPFRSTLTAGPALCRRPMRRIADPLIQMGAGLEGTEVLGEVFPPLTVHGARPLRAIRYPMRVASAQVKSAILLAGLFASGRTAIVERVQTRDHTERILQRFGARLGRDGTEISLEPQLLRSPGTLRLPGDFSSAAFFLVAASCVPDARMELTEVSLNPTRTGLLAILQRMGAKITAEVTDDVWEPRGTLLVTSAVLQGTTVTAQEVPGVIDELPILMVAASCARGVSRFEGVGELRVKETDRLASMMSGLMRLGAKVRLVGRDGVEIEGATLRAGEVSSAADHRTAMSLAVAGLIAEGGVTIVRQAECVTKSFPEFFNQLAQLAGSPTVKTVDKA